ncbi:invasion associated locus B family protein [Yoonia sp. GPGPB17]|uniref:invasion associated locus B family protein n=1 Tax=Yoonia sp. GPGPB17 TaxID=3026147 RepID=UPI0030BB3196
MLSEAFEDWQYRCILTQELGEPIGCELSQSVLVEQDGRQVEVLNIALSRAVDQASDVDWALVILTPKDVHLPSDFGLSFGSAEPQLIRYRNCNEVGCWVIVPGNASLIDTMKRQVEGTAYLRLLDGQVVRIVFSLRGFTRGFDAMSQAELPVDQRGVSE